MQAADPVNVLAGRYALEEELGRSATGLVWLATDTLLQRRVTVKLVHPRLADDPAFAAALADEVRRIAALDHPGLARLLDSGEERGVTYVVREYVEGTSLAARLATEGRLPVGDAVSTVADLLDTMEAIHAAGALHLSIDVDDVIVTPDGTVRLTDLGIGAAVAGAGPTVARDLVDTERAAPELVGGRTPDVRADVFAAGVLAFELLTGQPARGRTSVRDAGRDVPRRLDRVIARALDPEPARRFADATSFRRAIPRELEMLGSPPDHAGRGAGVLSWIGIPLMVAGIAAAAIALGLWLGTLEVGGPLGIRPAREVPEAPEIALRAERPVSAVAIDPFGDQSELSTNAPRAVDGDLDTMWRSEDYFDGVLGKPGIGLVLDLGSSRTIQGLRLWTPHPGYTIRIAVGEDPDLLVDQVGEEHLTRSITRVELDGTGRYVLIWITTVVPTDDGNRAEVAEARVVVPVSASPAGTFDA